MSGGGPGAASGGAVPPAFTPFPLRVLLGRVAREWARDRRIFDLPASRWFDASSGPDLSVEVLGRRAATPLGPAAGPHTQLAQNIALAWLGGARVIELKTVQVRDRLEIPRPCIDMETVGYNVEWSQELRLEQSLEEYAKAAMLIEVLRGWDALRPALGPDPGPHVLDLSVGYDLAGVTSPQVAAFIDGMLDARPTVDRLRAEIPEPFAPWRGHPFPARLVGSATVSTFHGCPPDEIAAIARHLMTRHDLDVVVKLNPTLLGRERVAGILLDELGYREVRLRPKDFERDLALPEAVDLIRELDVFARGRGRRFGIKLTNTLVVANHRGVLPADPMYLSGPPLHVLAVTLLDELRRAMPGTLALGVDRGGAEVSFSAGVTKANLPALAGLGIAPITACSDLLRPGGYGRLRPMLAALGEAMAAAGCGTIDAWRRRREAEAAAAGHDGAVGAYASEVRDAARNGAYTRAGTAARRPRRLDRALGAWDCTACNLCLTVCPNDAFFSPSPASSAPVRVGRQYLLFAELCNRCGNCAVFCPERGDPAAVKPALYLSPERFALADRPGFLLSRCGPRAAVTPAPGCEADAARVTALLVADDGLPLDPRDLGAAG